MNQYVKHTQRYYPLFFKLTVVEQVENSEMTYRQAQGYYGIQGSHTVLSWLKKYGQLNWLTSPSVRKCGANMPGPPQTPEQRIFIVIQ